MSMIVCKECSDEIDEGESLNGYCDHCVDKFIKREDAKQGRKQKPEGGICTVPKQDVTPEMYDAANLPAMGGFH